MTMHNYEFMLSFTLPDRDDKPERYLDALYEAGCDDASVGVGRQGMIGLDFTRHAESAETALGSAIRDVCQAIPGATLVQAGPDLVGLTDMAAIFGFSRQNMRKYATGQAAAREAFPPPTVLGDPSLWHLAEIAAWLRQNTDIRPSADLCAVAKAAARLNFEVERKRLQRILEPGE
jgi:predicted DNA-binding transcriptional regulator AlpA